MKKIFLLCSLFFYSAISMASHIVGGELSYRYIGDSTGIPYYYEITVKVYRNLESFSPPNQVTVYASSSCFSPLNLNINQVPSQGSDNDGSGGFLLPEDEGCIDTSSSKYLPKSVYLFRGNIILPGACADWTFGTFLPCCRNYIIDNISVDGLSEPHIQTRMNNMLEENSSVNENPMLHNTSLCVNNAVVLRPFDEDPDGDSVSLKLVHPISGPAPEDTCAFLPGYSVHDPITTLNGITIDQENGTLEFTPVQNEAVVLSVEASEHRYDSISQQYYVIGRKQTDILLSISDTCKSEIQNWALENFDLNNFEVKCLDQQIHLKSNIKFQRSSLISTDFRVLGKSGNIYPVINAQTNTSSTYATEIYLEMNKPFEQNDTLIISAKKGTDGNSVLNFCGFELQQDSIEVVIENCFVSLEERQKAKILIYPNPAKSLLHIETYGFLNGDITARITDQTGHLIKEQPVHNKQLNILNLKPGMYFIHLKGDQGYSYIKRFIKI